MASLMKSMRENSLLFGANAAFVEEIYEAYLADPASVTPEWRAYFDALPAAKSAHDVAHGPVQRAFAALPRSVQNVEAADVSLERKQVAVLQMINAHRFLGVRIANLDPLNRHAKAEVPELTLEHYGFTEADMATTFETGSLVAAQRMTLREIVQFLRQTYCSSIGAEYMYISDIQQKRWLQQRLEGSRGVANYPAAKRREILQRLTAAETLERYLHTKFVGQKRFSLEGGETLIPLLDHLLQRAGAQGVEETVIGMAHRGRLNVLVNILGKMPSMLFAEFEGKHAEHLTSGDVKYHNGFSSEIVLPDGNSSMHVTLAFNPSHLEIVSPVVEGSVRARQHTRGDHDGGKVMPVILHGDSAFTGQGVVMETFNLSQTRGYSTGGSVHIIINNQIGFTTSDVRDIRSSTYCTDVAKMVEAPIFHVNADDPEAVLLVTEIALDYRMTFSRDVVIDLVCFRKLGHNEQDEPLVTQPFMYRYINKHPGMRALYAQRLVEAGVIAADEPDAMIAAYRKAMDEGKSPVQTIGINVKRSHAKRWAKFSLADRWDTPINTGVSRERLQFLSERLTTVPENFKLHSRVEKIMEDRRAMGKGEVSLDWGMAENLAYATLLTEGYPVRLSGQDCGRGTFFHRHAVLHDQNRTVWHEGLYVPLRNLQAEQADVVVIDSTLSEEAVLAYEYGYATAEPDSLVIWEAQFGDFANGAQVVIDQFITSGEAKWGRLCGLVMLLPHGYEGQGAEHSSGRIERYLQLCADYNIQVCIPSTPAQMFHLLRRQMLRPYRKPLVVFTPKSLLRSKDAASPLKWLIEGSFQPVLSEADKLEANKVRRVIVCSGKIYYELIASRRERGIQDMAIIRLEQLYPFPHELFAAQIAAYPKATEVLWCQEEPGNQGAWHRIQHYLLRHMRKGMQLGYALRPSAAAPAAGYLAVHNEQQKAVIDAAFRDDLNTTNKPGAKHHEN
ncbi:MAG: 2-oxoglutarate dehydrogenase E1 component [Gallionellales bacterium 35-53-114]|jgi:2-oxoglutarate dehydrogenase E1 component|nr:MAG: 2-oxoglutarate dehydrogenase E1 component [Gallionellales bacterium 35-53-114]OYZ62188.1 MAG: 2-oxoglutarate dehydrogenase E1 component [Gallionellales bacterium 24-53-125]OZB07247.1 MAG: 2-oxoglutarate dehydrogenase E1 component [Gallionellales bacterium 39-52-133]HQS59795.1 2-oxoglutarate dehydrogenase E1 component [Gallionellaceae bacterium]HQS76549.1 2-oxoglutarate dehydrogenase E1 component [Gallionellaceae bacterium]